MYRMGQQWCSGGNCLKIPQSFQKKLFFSFWNNGSNYRLFSQNIPRSQETPTPPTPLEDCLEVFRQDNITGPHGIRVITEMYKNSWLSFGYDIKYWIWNNQ